MYQVKTSSTESTLEINGTLTLDFNIKATSQEDLENKLALISSLGIVDANLLLMHVDGTVSNPQIVNVECDVEYVEGFME